MDEFQGFFPAVFLLEVLDFCHGIGGSTFAVETKGHSR